MYNLRARVSAASAGAVRPQLEMRSHALPAIAASQVTPSQALEIIDDVMAVPETEVYRLWKLMLSMRQLSLLCLI